MSLTVFGKHRINNFKFLSLKIQTFLKMLRHGLLFQRNKITEIAGLGGGGGKPHKKKTYDKNQNKLKKVVKTKNF